MKTLRRPSASLVIACAALFVALSGSSYAVIVLPKNSVGTKQLRNNAVVSSKVAFDSLTGLDINEGRLGVVPAANSVGGWTATAMLAKTTVQGPSALMCSPTVGFTCSVGSSLATCPVGMVAIGGGWNGESSPPVDATVGYNQTYGTSWGVIMANNALISATFHAFAVCAPSSTGLLAGRPVGRDAERAAFAAAVAVMEDRVAATR